nr:ABC transporter permease [Pseudogemmobacter faecipullorum]
MILEKRPEPSRFWLWTTPVLAVVLTMIMGGLLFAMLGKNPVTVIRTIFWDPVFGPNAAYFQRQLVIKAAPLILIATGLAMGFRAGIWNIGAEGQYIIGAVAGASLGLALYPTESRWIFPAMVLAGALGGWIWAMIPAILKTKFNANEILVSLMLVYVAQAILSKAAFGFLRNPEGMGFPGSRNLGAWPAARNADLIAGTGFHWGAAAALAVAIGAYVLLTRHGIGFQIRLTGQAPRAARFHGVDPSRLIIFCLGLTGVLAGLAGIFEATGPGGQITEKFASGYGFTAIIVAFLGRLNPLGIVLAGLLMALTYVGGSYAEGMMNLPAASIQVFQGMLLFFLLGVDMLTNYRIRLRGRSGKGAAK